MQGAPESCSNVSYLELPRSSERENGLYALFRFYWDGLGEACIFPLSMRAKKHRWCLYLLHWETDRLWLKKIQKNENLCRWNLSYLLWSITPIAMREIAPATLAAIIAWEVDVKPRSPRTEKQPFYRLNMCTFHTLCTIQEHQRKVWPSWTCAYPALL